LKNAKAQEPRRAGALVLKRPSISVADFYSGAMAQLCSGVDTNIRNRTLKGRTPTFGKAWTTH
jgi:hypothetical protein